MGLPRVLVATSSAAIRDFRGARAVIRRPGNYSLASASSWRFPRSTTTRWTVSAGLEISIVTTAKTDEESARICSSSSARPSPRGRGEERNGKEVDHREAEAARRSTRCEAATAAPCAPAVCVHAPLPRCAASVPPAGAVGELPGVTKSSWKKMQLVRPDRGHAHARPQCVPGARQVHRAVPRPRSARSPGSSRRKASSPTSARSADGAGALLRIERKHVDGRCRSLGPERISSRVCA